MSSFEDYYNGFYKELSKLDEVGNTFSKIESFLPILKGDEQFLDIGCGHGGVSGELVKRGYKVSGIEINKDAIESLKLKNVQTEWGDYYNFTNYSENSALHKTDALLLMIDRSKARTVLDVGSNNGHYSRMVAKTGSIVISADIDPISVEYNYLTNKNTKISNVTPIIQDIANPSSRIGWGHNERSSLQDRGPFELVMALALVHHLAISNNVPFEMVAEYFSKLGKLLIIEFIPKEDSQVIKLLSSREDIFYNYNEDKFEKSFGKYYTIINKVAIKESCRTLYLMQAKSD